MSDHLPASLPRAHSTDSSDALSNIDVSRALQAAAVASTTGGASSGQSSNSSSRDGDREWEREGGEGLVETPPTSLAEEGSQGGGGRRSARTRGVRSYNLKTLSDAQLPMGAGAGGRSASGWTGKTLVEDDEEAEQDAGADALSEDKEEKGGEVEPEVPAASAVGMEKRERGGSAKLQRRPSVKERVKKVASRVGSVLGKRGREVLGSGKAKKAAASPAVEEEVEDAHLPRWKKQLDTGKKGVLDELDLDAELADLPAPPPAKKARLSVKAGKSPSHEIPQPTAAPIPTAKALAAGKKMKKWQKEGLYVGQDSEMDPMAVPSGRKKLQKKSRPVSSASNATSDETTKPRASFITLPMFSYLDKTRDFTIPFDVFAPSWRKGDEKPRDWHQLNKNRLVGEAKELWEHTQNNLPPSLCVCQPPGPGEQGCDEVCLNRVMQYECNTSNCNLSSDNCSNRAFAELTQRLKRGGAYDIGVEVLKTPNRGFGVRSCRTFAPGQIIMEYTGEIITEGECQRRMREMYKDRSCYYLMELERGLIIDGTKGSMARFINHSCEPNCEVRMVKVNGTPRMGVFAGEEGVGTGEELTYDYNFDNFGTSHQICYCGAEGCRGFLSKRLNKEEMKKVAREEIERKRKAAEEAQRHARKEEEGRRKKMDRGSGWRGWIALDDPETRERLKREKKEKEEAEKLSGRALRMARRRGSPAPQKPVETEEVKGKDTPKRKRKVVQTTETMVETSAPAVLYEKPTSAGAASTLADLAPPSPKRNKLVHTRTLSSSNSKFTEQLSDSPANDSIDHPALPSLTQEPETSIHDAAAAHASAIVEDENDDDEAITLTAPAAAGQKRKRPFAAAARTLGQAVRSGLGLKGDAGSGSGSGSASAGSSGKLKQSTLSFGRKG
ncbi:hypothetical protein B0A50_06507 [Salinomyces thailandicus]|uniref:SET domain-containing protein n=1 Tax=Salinomyces thailandicus TaxID=706561 RepID=A0A4U0TNR3_9PEZI|nr:hypothetical protein B0A50_06507 [Salinomyces thailandica]